jgi:hypothetical protein
MTAGEKTSGGDSSNGLAFILRNQGVNRLITEILLHQKAELHYNSMYNSIAIQVAHCN